MESEIKMQNELLCVDDDALGEQMMMLQGSVGSICGGQ